MKFPAIGASVASVWRAVIAAAPVKVWLTAGAAIAWTGFTAWLVWLYDGRIGTDQAFWIIETAMFLVLVAIVALTGTEISFRAGRDGVNANVGQDVEPVAEVVTKTTVAAVTPKTDEEAPPWVR